MSRKSRDAATASWPSPPRTKKGKGITGLQTEGRRKREEKRRCLIVNNAQNPIKRENQYEMGLY